LHRYQFLLHLTREIAQGLTNFQSLVVTVFASHLDGKLRAKLTLP
jgi:hypothetical protein